MAEEFFIQGNEACAKGALKAGCRFFAGYPITPSTEVAETLSRELPKVGGSFVQMEDEIENINHDSNVLGALPIVTVDVSVIWAAYTILNKKYF